MSATVTIVSPCYNHARYVVEHLESIRSQDYPGIQHIIIDDASSDGSAEIIERWIAEREYECLFIRHQANQGLSRTLNEALSSATGEYWCYVGTDDLILPQRTRELVNYLEAHPECPYVSCGQRVIDAESNPALMEGHETMLSHMLRRREGFDLERDYGTLEQLLIFNHIPIGLGRTSLFKEAGGFDPKLRLEDWDMMIRLSSKGRLAIIPGELDRYRWHPSNTSKDNGLMRREVLKTFLKHYALVSESFPETADRISRIHFHDAVINSRSLTNLFMFMRSPLRGVIFPELWRRAGNWSVWGR